MSENTMDKYIADSGCLPCKNYDLNTKIFSEECYECRRYYSDGFALRESDIETKIQYLKEELKYKQKEWKQLAKDCVLLIRRLNFIKLIQKD